MSEMGCGVTLEAPSVGPCGGFSMSQRRKMRVKRTAVLKSHDQTATLKLLLLRGVGATEPQPSDAAEHIVSRMAIVEAKLESVLALLASTFSANTMAWSPQGLVFLDDQLKRNETNCNHTPTSQIKRSSHMNPEANEFVPLTDNNLPGLSAPESTQDVDAVGEEEVDPGNLDAREKSENEDMSESDREVVQHLEARVNDIDASLLVACADTVAAMYALCQEDVSLGLHSKMTPASRARSQAIPRELWHGFVALCKQGGVQPYPESLSSAAGCITSDFADAEPDIEEFGKMLLSEISMM